MIKIQKEARDYILSKGGVLQIRNNPPVAGCCGRFALEPSVEVGAPKMQRGYVIKEIDGICVYVDEMLYSPNLLTVVVHSFWGWKRLSIDGWKMV